MLLTEMASVVPFRVSEKLSFHSMMSDVPFRVTGDGEAFLSRVKCTVSCHGHSLCCFVLQRNLSV